MATLRDRLKRLCNDRNANREEIERIVHEINKGRSINKISIDNPCRSFSDSSKKGGSGISQRLPRRKTEV